MDHFRTGVFRMEAERERKMVPLIRGSAGGGKSPNGSKEGAGGGGAGGGGGKVCRQVPLL
jgi:hypothetical protein